MEHSSRSLYYAVKNKGGFLLKNGKQSALKCSSASKLDKSTKIYADEFFDDKRNTTFIHDTFISKLEGYNFLHENSSAVHYADLASGKADLVLECTRKGNLEIAVAFGLVNEAGGVIATIDGVSIKDKKYLELGQKKHIPVISASTMELANELIDKVK
jgi:fructose-1,6-bisphosphatase/inositol monophosphatase family enzyme